MCGIIVILSNNNIANTLINGLTQLQNRGYDSAGIAYIENSKIIVRKRATTNKVDSIDIIGSLIKNKHINCAIGHTRWATHGRKSDTNSHPHNSYDNVFSLVHNGIIENYIELKKFLETKNIKSVSETDSEIIVNLLAYNYSISNDITTAIHSTTTTLKGTWGLAIICKETPNKIYCIRRECPLILGIHDDMLIVTSEVAGFNNTVDKIINIKNNELVILNKSQQTLSHNCTGNFQIFNNTTQYKLTPAPYTYWLEKEINDQYMTTRKAYNNRIHDNKVLFSSLESNSEILKSLDNIIIIGCGTSLYAAKMGEIYFKNQEIFYNVSSYDASEFSLKDIPKIGKSGIIMMSQSGETRDVIKVLHLARDNYIYTIGIINIMDSYIATNTDCCIYLKAGREVSVASTKSFTGQLIVLKLLGEFFYQLKSINSLRPLMFKEDLFNLHHQIFNVINILNDTYQSYIPLLNKNSLFVLGKGKYYPIAQEASLKIKEITYIHSEGYSGSALKHGAYSLLTKEFPVILFIMDDEYKHLMCSCYEEIKSREATILVITDIKDNHFDNKIIIPKTEFAEILIIIIIQYLSFYIAKEHNLPIDRPRNLAKCVTTD